MDQYKPFENSKITNLVDLLRENTQNNPDKIIYKFLEDGEDSIKGLTYADLDLKARAIASRLQEMGLAGQRALLLYPPDLEYIIGFFACLYAGVTAVPAYPPDPNRLERTIPRLEAIARDCQTKVILTTSFIKGFGDVLLAQAPDLTGMEMIATDSLSDTLADDWQCPKVSPETIAFLQYTSGSTGDPKGVILTHANLLHNMELIRTGYGINKENTRCGLSWLPPYHDMGLIGGILVTLYVDIPSIVMSPLHFLQRPIRWLKAISKFGANISGGPNFAYEMCVRKINSDQLEDLDLSSWNLAFSGAESILPGTLNRFVEKFGPVGFQREAFYPCYGLAEGTLIVSGGNKNEIPKLKIISKENFKKLQISREPLSEEDKLEIVGCGTAFSGHAIKVVRPDVKTSCPDGEVGEIWVQGPSIAQGYWQKPEKTEETFRAQLADSGEGPFLRTGDLGFLSDGEIYVTGRIKDLLVIRGNNHYPQDIESSLVDLHPALRQGCSAAFSIQHEMEENLVIAQEIDSGKISEGKEEVEKIFKEIRRRISTQHDLDVYSIQFVKKGGVPKTSSGKVRRHACQDEYLEGTLDVLYESVSFKGKENSKSSENINAIVGDNSSEYKPHSRERGPFNYSQIEAWLIENLADHLDIDPKDVDPKQSLAEFGLDSKDAVNFSGELEDFLGITLSPTVLWKYPTIKGLAEYLTRRDLPTVVGET